MHDQLNCTYYLIKKVFLYNIKYFKIKPDPTHHFQGCLTLFYLCMYLMDSRVTITSHHIIK